MQTVPEEPSASAGPARPDLAAVLRAARSRAAELRASGAWPEGEDAELAASFEAAAEQALRVPALVERSPGLRRLARRVVPPIARPPLRRLAARVDLLLRSAFEELERRIDRGRQL